MQLGFDRSFNAGAHARFHPGAMAIDFSMTRNQIVQMNAGETMSKALAQSHASSTRGEIFRDLPEETKEFFAIRAHEQDHLRRLLATSYGMFGDSVRNSWLGLVARMVEERSMQGLPILDLPFLDWIPPELSFEGSFDRIRARSSTGSHTKTLVQGLGNLLSALADEVLPSQFASAIWGLTNGGNEQVQSLVSEQKQFSSASRLKDNRGNLFGLNGRQLLELFAVGEHGNALLRTGSPLSTVEFLLTRSSEEYALAILAWNSLFGSSEALSTSPPAEQDLIIDWYRLFPFELFIAADLALWPPFYPNEELRTENELAWSDIAPGPRFLRILATMKDLQVTPQAIPTSDRNEQFIELQHRVCHRLGWPTPHELASAWFHQMQLQTDASMWTMLDDTNLYRMQQTAKLLRLRLDRPADFVLNNINFPEHGVLGSPVWILREEDGRHTPISMGGPANTWMTPMMMMEVTRHLLEREQVTMTPVYEQEFRKTAVEQVSATFAKHGVWDESLARRFKDEAHKAFRTHD